MGTLGEGWRGGESGAEENVDLNKSKREKNNWEQEKIFTWIDSPKLSDSMI